MWSWQTKNNCNSQSLQHDVAADQHHDHHQQRSEQFFEEADHVIGISRPDNHTRTASPISNRLVHQGNVNSAVGFSLTRDADQRR